MLGKECPLDEKFKQTDKIGMQNLMKFLNSSFSKNSITMEFEDSDLENEFL